jgi:NitT/TauT family transport system permease protein
MAAANRLAFDPVRRGRRLVSVVAVLVVWAVVANIGVVPNLPAPSAVAAAFAGAVTGSAFWVAAAKSTFRVYIAFAVAAALAIPLGLLIGWNVVFGDLLFPSFEMLRPVPPVAWIPVMSLVAPYLTVAFGPVNYAVNTGVLFITFLGAFFPILLNAIQGVQALDEEYPSAARSLGTSPAQTFRHVVYPGSLPSIHAGMVNGMGLAWVNLVAAEMIAGSGLGYLTWSSYIASDYATIVVGMISIGLLGFVSSFIVRRVGNRQLSWAETTSA